MSETAAPERWPYVPCNVRRGFDRPLPQVSDEPRARVSQFVEINRGGLSRGAFRGRAGRLSGIAARGCSLARGRTPCNPVRGPTQRLSFAGFAP